MIDRINVVISLHVGDPQDAFSKHAHGFKTKEDVDDIRDRIQNMVLSCYDPSHVAFSDNSDRIIGLYWMVPQCEAPRGRIDLFWDRMVQAAQFGRQYA